ncbi:MAG: hypothetical protein ACREL1_07050 [bacterium]
MRNFAIFFLFFFVLAASAWGQFQANLQPLGLEARIDNNVFRSVSDASRLSDEINTWTGGMGLRYRSGDFQISGDYSLDADIYGFYSELDNFIHDFNFSLSQGVGPFIFRYANDSFFRSSAYDEFDYFDEANTLGIDYRPNAKWDLAGTYEFLAREYYGNADAVASRNFTDDGVGVSAQRNWTESFSAKLNLKWTNRQFNRYAVAVSNSGLVSAMSFLQNDQTFYADLGFHLYFLNVLQNIHLTAARTNSNSYGFSNSVESASWAGVLSPVHNFYLELFFRFYEKDYDYQPLAVPDLQLGFTNDDGQDLLALKGTWEWSPGWTASLGMSRVKNESATPAEYYIKDMISAQVRRAF